MLEGPERTSCDNRVLKCKALDGPRAVECKIRGLSGRQVSEWKGKERCLCRVNSGNSRVRQLWFGTS